MATECQGKLLLLVLCHSRPGFIHLFKLLKKKLEIEMFKWGFYKVYIYFLIKVILHFQKIDHKIFSCCTLSILKFPPSLQTFFSILL